MEVAVVEETVLGIIRGAKGYGTTAHDFGDHSLSPVANYCK